MCSTAWRVERSLSHSLRRLHDQSAHIHTTYMVLYDRLWMHTLYSCAYADRLRTEIRTDSIVLQNWWHYFWFYYFRLHFHQYTRAHRVQNISRPNKLLPICAPKMVKRRNKQSANRKNKLAEVRNLKFVLDEPVYAKLAGFCPWPAKITNLFGRWCDVFFFGAPEE